ncbi:hypothetical protein KX729_23360 [Rhizobium sp. XQZ8]|uniref:hypothetical protein n=1 Tax=Rhizobium populisoli TaxID=2859785 RepID=UPI001CA4D155|nr:hypothetical protein [Rhizobium populisoli]MBW6424396.1 hypothetical protein [Rhizobium populisoli]
MHSELQRPADQAAAMGLAVLVPGLRISRPIDIARATFLSIDDRRAIFAAWASDLYAVDSQPSLRHLPGTPGPVSIDEVQVALIELDRRSHY